MFGGGNVIHLDGFGAATIQTARELLREGSVPAGRAFYHKPACSSHRWRCPFAIRPQYNFSPL